MPPSPPLSVVVDEGWCAFEELPGHARRVLRPRIIAQAERLAAARETRSVSRLAFFVTDGHFLVGCELRLPACQLLIASVTTQRPHLVPALR